MLTKIGDSWVDLEAVAAAEYAEATKLDPERFLVTLRSGGTLCLYCSPGELEEALVRAGVAAGGEDINVPGSIPEGDLSALVQLLNSGYQYLARDGDGTVFAYRNRPWKNRTYWTPATHDNTNVVSMGRDAFLFVEASAEEPFDIGEALGRHAEV